jgi:hypothetical protein
MFTFRMTWRSNRSHGLGLTCIGDGASCYRRRLLPDDGLAEVVEDVLSRVRTRRREIEAAGVGSA